MLYSLNRMKMKTLSRRKTPFAEPARPPNRESTSGLNNLGEKAVVDNCPHNRRHSNPRGEFAL
jgi:hypothetical protein